MSNYLKTEEVLKDLNIKIFKLFDLCKKGKLQAYNEDGDRVVDPDSCEKGKKDFNEFLHLVQMEEGGKAIRNAFRRNRCSSPEDIEKPLTSEEKQREALKRYNAQPDIPIIPERCVGFDFTVPTRPSYFPFFQSIQELRKQKIKEAEAFIFKKSDIEKLKTEKRLRLEKECGSDKPVPKSKQLVDEFVRSLTIYPEDDYTINIQVPGRQAEPFTGPTLGFHKKRGKEWRFLQEIIQEGRYCTGSTTIREGDAKRKRLTTVEGKLIRFLNKKFNVKILPDYKLFEISEHEKGIWKPKFKIRPAGKDSSQTKEQILEKLKAQYKKDADQETINDLVLAAKKKGISNDDLANIIPSKHKNEEEYDYKEGGHVANKP